MHQGTRGSTGVEVLVLDEADRMLDMGFKPQLDAILAKVPRAAADACSSRPPWAARWPIRQSHLKDPVRVEVARSGTTAARAEQRVYPGVAGGEAPAAPHAARQDETPRWCSPAPSAAPTASRRGSTAPATR